MGIIRRDYYKKGDHNAISDDSAQKYKRSDMRLTWDGKLVGKDEWYPKHPQLTIRPIPDRPAITNQTRTQDSPTNLLAPSFNPSAPNNVLIEGFIVNLSGDNITESNGSVTGMLNSVNSDYDLTTVVGTGANLKKSINDAMLCYGATGDYASTPDSAAASITGDIDIRIHLSMDNWVPASTEVLVSKFLTAGDQRSFFFQVNTNGTLTFDVSTLGTNASRVPYASSSAPPSVNGEEMWLRVILDTDNGAGGSRATFYTSEDGQIWSQFDTTLVGSTVSIFDSTAEVAIAGVSGLNLNGSVYEAQILNGIDGTLAVDFNAADYVNRTNDTEFPSSATGEEWTLNGNTFIQNTGHSVVHSIGDVGIESATGKAIASGATVFTVGRVSNNPTSNRYFYDQRGNTGDRFTLFTLGSQSDSFSIEQGVALTAPDSFDNDAHVFVAQYKGDSTSKIIISGVSSQIGSAGSENWDYATLFADGDGALAMEGYIAELVVYDRVLTDAEITSTTNYLLEKYSL